VKPGKIWKDLERSGSSAWENTVEKSVENNSKDQHLSRSAQHLLSYRVTFQYKTSSVSNGTLASLTVSVQDLPHQMN